MTGISRRSSTPNGPSRQRCRAALASRRSRRSPPAARPTDRRCAEPRTRPAPGPRSTTADVLAPAGRLDDGLDDQHRRDDLLGVLGDLEPQLRPGHPGQRSCCPGRSAAARRCSPGRRSRRCPTVRRRASPARPARPVRPRLAGRRRRSPRRSRRSPRRLVGASSVAGGRQWSRPISARPRCFLFRRKIMRSHPASHISMLLSAATKLPSIPPVDP